MRQDREHIKLEQLKNNTFSREAFMYIINFIV